MAVDSLVDDRAAMIDEESMKDTPTIARIAFLMALPALLPAAEDEIVARWTFDSAASIDGWTVGRGIDGLEVHDGRLRGTTTHHDAYLFAPPVNVPIDGLVVRVRWASPRGSQTQCYFATDRSTAMGEDKVVSRETRGGGLVETEFPLGTTANRDQTLTRFRLDPFNGQVGAPFEIDEVALVRLPSRIQVSLAFERPVVSSGQPVALVARCALAGGRTPEGRVRVRLVRPRLEPVVELDLSRGEATGSFPLTFETSGVHVARAVVEQGDRVTHELDATVVVGLPRAPGELALETGDVGIELLPVADGAGAGAAVAWFRDRGVRRIAALLSPLVALAFEEDGVVRRVHPALTGAPSEGGVLLVSSRPRVEVRLAGVDRSGVRIGATLPQPPRGGILQFAAPAVRVLPREPAAVLERHALFGGLEFLEPGWRSSSARSVGERFASRWRPHPHRVSLPAMAIETDGVTVAVLWHPLREWSHGERMPAATFASPNLLESGADHLMQLSAPGVPLVPENTDLPPRPIEVDGEVSLEMIVDVFRGGVVESASRWYDRFGIPEPPPWPHDERATHDLIARSFGETVYWSEENGWRAHWFLDRGSRFRSDFAAELILHARVTGDDRRVRATGLADRPLLATYGLLWDQARGGRGSAEAALRAMREDGTFPFRNTDWMRRRMREHTGGAHDSLGDDGSTSLGTCVQGALPLVRHWFLTGDERLGAAAERALVAMRRFRVPRGAQVWEVHQQVPDIRAAALAVEAFRMAAIATGKEEYIDDALSWARAGLPFLFSWRPPLDAATAVVRTSRDRDDFEEKIDLPLAELYRDGRRQVNPFGAIPVFGSSYFVVGWFGVLVQWCGLEWAWKVEELLELRDDPLLRAASAGVIRSGLQQMFDRPPWTGLYPDVWNLLENRAGGALISPILIAGALRAHGRLPRELSAWSRRVGEGDEARVLHGWGRPIECTSDADGRTLRITVEFLAGEECELLITRSSRPREVNADGHRLEEGDGGDQWRHDAEGRLLGVRFPSRGRSTIVVRF